MASCMSCLLSRSSNHRSQHFCDVCKYMFRMDRSNMHNNRCSNRVFKVYAFCHHCSTVHEVPHRLGSTMMCLSNSSLSNTTHHSLVHHHPMAANNKSTFYHGIDDMHDNNDSPTSNIVDNDSNCLRDSSESNESSSFLNGSSTYEGSKVFFNGLNRHKFYYNSSQDKIGFIPHNTDEWHPCPSSIPDTIIMTTEHESTWAWAHVVHKWEYSITKHLWQSHEMGPFSYCWWVQVWCSKLLHIEKNKWTTHSPILLIVVV